MYIVHVLELTYYLTGNVHIEKYEEIHNCCHYSICSRLFLRLLYSPHHGCKKILHTDNCIRKGGMSYIGLEPWT